MLLNSCLRFSQSVIKNIGFQLNAAQIIVKPCSPCPAFTAKLIKAKDFCNSLLLNLARHELAAK
jgi:hypothetical protein